MSGHNTSPESKLLSVGEMRGWLLEEIKNVMKACDLRTRDATEFVTAYALGELTAEEAHSRLKQYEERWNEALPGIYASSYSTDEAVLDAIDSANRGHRDILRSNERLLGRGRGATHNHER